jgi:hypothetical protein
MWKSTSNKDLTNIKCFGQTCNKRWFHCTDPEFPNLPKEHLKNPKTEKVKIPKCVKSYASSFDKIRVSCYLSVPRDERVNGEYYFNVLEKPLSPTLNKLHLHFNECVDITSQQHTCIRVSDFLTENQRNGDQHTFHSSHSLLVSCFVENIFQCTVNIYIRCIRNMTPQKYDKINAI